MMRRLVLVGLFSIFVFGVAFANESAQMQIAKSVIKVRLIENTINKFSYAFDIDNASRFHIVSGDRILFNLSFAGIGIKDGYVEGEALDKGHGAWKVVQKTPGDIIFQATTEGYVDGPFGNFVLIGENESAPASIYYGIVGELIGSSETEILEPRIKTKTVTGIIDSVTIGDAKKGKETKIVVISEQGEKIVFKVKADPCSVEIDGKYGDLGYWLRKGDRVRVEYPTQPLLISIIEIKEPRRPGEQIMTSKPISRQDLNP